MPRGAFARQTDGVDSAPAIERVLPWLLRVVWIGVLLAGGQALDDALADATDVTTGIVQWGVFAIWVAGALAMAVPAVATLTATRVIVPLVTPVAVACALGGADLADVLPLAAVGLLATVVALTGELGRLFVQASAYGDEDRHVLRPPAAYLAIAVLAWVLWSVALTLTGAAVSQERWIVAAIAGLVTIGGAVLGAPRWHRLSRRWLVLVPVGMVVHDQLVLAETLMLRRQEIGAVGLAPAGTDAADLTGPATGHAIEVRTTESVTALRAATPAAPRGTAVHLTGFIISPTRPGRVLAAAARRRLPVGAV